MASTRKVIRASNAGTPSRDAPSRDDDDPVPPYEPGQGDAPILTAIRAVLDEFRYSELPAHDGDASAASAECAPVAIAFSAGLDSTVLLQAATRVLGAGRCIALHVHHGLSPHADAWVDHARSTAAQLGCGFAMRHVDLSAYRGTGVEAAARDARYRALFELCEESGVGALLLAHHADDQAETFLLQAVRGAGLRGLSSMPHVGQSPESSLPVGRPLLALRREALLAYAQRHRLSWIDDESNEDRRYTRNALRHDVLEPLASHVPSYREGLARSARHAAEAQALLDEIAALDLQALVPVDMKPDRTQITALSLAAWRALDASSTRRAANVLRYWIREQGLRSMSEARFDDFVDKLRDAGAARSVSFVHEHRILRSYRDVLSWEPGEPMASSHTEAAQVQLDWTGQSVWHLPRWRGTLVFVPTDHDDPHRIAVDDLRRQPLLACERRGGERMREGVDRPSRSLKNLFQEAGTPAWQRDVPLIYLGPALLFVPGLGLNHAIPRTSSSQRWCRLEWRPDLLMA